MSNKKFVKDSAITLTRQVTSIVIGMLLLIVLARFLGPEGQGNYTLITLLPMMLLTFLNMGMNVSNIYFVSKGEIDIHSSFKSNLFIGLILSFISVLIGIIVVMFLSEQFFSSISPSILYLSLAALPFMFLTSFFQTIFQGLQNFKIFNTILVVTQITTLILVIMSIGIFNFGLVGAIFSFVFGYVTTFFFILWVFFKKYQVQFNKGRFSVSYFRKGVIYGLKSHISNVVTFLNYRLDIYLVGYFLNSVTVGIYAVAVNIAERLSIFSQSISSVLLPRIASYKTEQERNALTSVVSRNIFVLVLIMSAVIFIIAEFLISLLFGHEYSESTPLLKILLPGIIVLSVEKVLSNDIAGRGKPEINMYVSIFNVMLNVVLNLMWIPMYGVVGAATATTVTYIVSFIIKMFIYKKITGQSIKTFMVLQKSDIQMYKRLVIQTKNKVINYRKGV